MCVSEDELQKDMSKVFDHIIYAREDVVRQSLEIQELKSDFADVRQEMNAKEDNMRHNMEDIVCNEVKKATKCLEDIVSNEVKKAMKCLEEKLDALLVKLSEKDNWKRLRETTTSHLIPAVLRMDDFRNRNAATWKIYHGIKVQEFIGLLGLLCVTKQIKRNRR